MSSIQLWLSTHPLLFYQHVSSSNPLFSTHFLRYLHTLQMKLIYTSEPSSHFDLIERTPSVPTRLFNSNGVVGYRVILMWRDRGIAGGPYTPILNLVFGLQTAGYCRNYCVVTQNGKIVNIDLKYLGTSSTFQNSPSSRRKLDECMEVV